MWIYVVVGILQYLSSLGPDSWSLIFSILLYPFDARMHYLTDTTKIKKITKDGYSTMNDDKGKPFGFIWGFLSNNFSSFYIGKFSTPTKDNPIVQFTFLCRDLYLANFEKAVSTKIQTDSKEICKTVRSHVIGGSTIFGMNFLSEMISIPKGAPSIEQEKILSSIRLERQNNEGPTILFISGPSGTGKSSMALFLAFEYGLDYIPWSLKNPGCVINQAFEQAGDKGAVIAFEEIDDVIIPAFNGGIKVDSDCAKQDILTKSDWNSLMDRINRMANKNLIFVLTSNYSSEELIQKCGGDTSFLSHRVPNRFELLTNSFDSKKTN